MTKSTFTKTKAQIKSSRYYLFWGAATIVVVGQIYIGNGYRRMADTGDPSLDRIYHRGSYNACTQNYAFDKLSKV